MPEAEQNTVYWDQFWQQGEAACCDEPGQSGHAGAVESVWKGLFESLPAGSTVLDICTGNGAVLALAAASGRVGQGVGVDFAQTSPTPGTGLAFVRASVTALPLDDESFDAVVSQFGIEYTPLDASLAEVARVLKPGGQAVFVVHAAGGVTATGATAKLADLDEFLEQRETFAAAREALGKVVPLERESSPPEPSRRAAAEAAYRRFYAELEWLGAEWQARRAGDVFQSTGALLQHSFQHRQSFPLAALLSKVDETEASVRFHRDRLRALVRAARDREAMTAFVERAAAHGFVDPGFAPIEVNGQTTAWRFAARRDEGTP